MASTVMQGSAMIARMAKEYWAHTQVHLDWPKSFFYRYHTLPQFGIFRIRR